MEVELALIAAEFEVARAGQGRPGLFIKAIGTGSEIQADDVEIGVVDEHADGAVAIVHHVDARHGLGAVSRDSLSQVAKVRFVLARRQ